MSSNQSKRARTKARLKKVFIWLQTLIGSILFLGLVSAIGALLFFAWLAQEVVKGGAQEFDEIIRLFVYEFASAPLTAFMNFVTFLGSTLFLSVFFVCLLIFFIRCNWKRAAALLTITMAGAVILNFVLKASFARPRPTPFFNTPLPDSYSFPSGHALFALCFYGTVAWLVTTRTGKRSLKILIWLVAVLLITLIGISRIYLSVHYLSDVMAGYAASIVWISTIMLVDSILKNKGDFLKKYV
ncbi:MAG: phosphatase PAP2 family protein [Acidobacteriota bacterium]|nr:phosphatase PAP2 family protein [Acidobacteriota bacterium]